MLKHIRAWWTYLRRLLTLPRTLRVTATGWKFIGLTLIVGFAGINTANNLLYLVFGCMLSFIITSGILSELMLRKVHLTRTFPRHIFAKTPCPVTVALANRKRFIPSFSLLVEDFSHGSPAATAYVLKIGGNASLTTTYMLTFPQRGFHRPGRVRLSTRYPFGLFHKSASFVETDEMLLVYPEVYTLHPADVPRPAAHIGEVESARQGRGLEIHGIREYVRGDTTGRIDWKSSAKLAKLMTKEFQDDQRRRVSLVMDVSLSEQRISTDFVEETESVISLTASYVVHFLQQQMQLQLITPEQRTPFDSGQRHAFALLRLLAEFQPKKEPPRKRPLNALRRSDRANTLQLVVSRDSINTSRTVNAQNQRNRIIARAEPQGRREERG